MTARLIACHSIIALNARHPVAARALLDAQDMHRLVMSGFHGWVEDGQPDARAQMGILSTWNVDLKSNTLLMVVQSKLAPNWSLIPKDALTTRIETISVDQPLRKGDQFTFRTVVNALTARRDARTPERRTRKMPAARPDHVRDWLMKRAQPTLDGTTAESGARFIGAEIDPQSLAIRMLPPVTSSHHAGLKINRSEVRGKLAVTDPGAFHSTLADGIGSARAYGCGLVLIRQSGP
ncbi:type I-E CRISPR-associated protein Cas6/Cse3/CasE [Streptomyces hesseae]|uniref:Type I-E CRISPR-associated protein Cas6/Cse3/CasE n=1 Tax=Streptomyces hesseae TaxID=3075519 RepID=A0ABU2T0F6_9ACTN|nr:type I-E CRISPR-associated protein Cas6/Cse3/CasE [Streptomyces sp. DSM 40473]MDT0453659.1 type I-E CRISPR-associated protein Cas6/Cse3/CasE [Streptomyces sp. DSM 40473]